MWNNSINNITVIFDERKKKCIWIEKCNLKPDQEHFRSLEECNKHHLPTRERYMKKNGGGCGCSS